MKKIAIGALAFLILASCCWGQQSIVTTKFKAQWRSIAGTKAIDLTEYDRVSQMSVAGDRKKYIKTLPQDAQITLWQVHITYSLANFKYTPAQLALVKESVKYLVPAFFQVRDLKFEEQSEDWFKRLQEAFKDDIALYKFTFEVPGDIEVISMCPLKPSGVRTVNASFEKSHSTCDCTWSPGCDSGVCCPGTYNGCSGVINCGPFGWFKCTGLCSQICPFEDPDPEL